MTVFCIMQYLTACCVLGAMRHCCMKEVHRRSNSKILLTQCNDALTLHCSMCPCSQYAGKLPAQSRTGIVSHCAPVFHQNVVVELQHLTWQCMERSYPICRVACHHSRQGSALAFRAAELAHASDTC